MLPSRSGSLRPIPPRRSYEIGRRRVRRPSLVLQPLAGRRLSELVDARIEDLDDLAFDLKAIGNVDDVGEDAADPLGIHPGAGKLLPIRHDGGGILIAAGLYQWSPIKYACLSNCRAPLQLIQQYGGFKGQALPSLKLGFRHGIYCIGCCGPLMLLLFVGGVMNILWIAGLSILVLLEKVMSDGRNVSRIVGLGLIIGGTLLIIQHFFPSV